MTMPAETAPLSAAPGRPRRPLIRVWLLITLFAAGYAALVLALGIVPLNLLLRRVLGADAMPGVWRDSLLRLCERTAVAAATCWVCLALTGRARGLLTGKGLLVVGAAISGALAGAADAGLQRIWVGQLVRAARVSPMLGIAASTTITIVITIVVTLALIIRSTSPARTPQDVLDQHQREQTE